MKAVLMDDDKIKKIQLLRIIQSSWRSFESDIGFMLLFTIINYVTLVLGFYSWTTPLLWLVLVGGYIFWSYFFRYYFKRKPYFLLEPMLRSMIPSTKIVVFSTLLVTALVVLPFLPLFMGLSGDYIDSYTIFLQKYMDDTDYIDMFLNFILVVTSPLVFYRPFLAWISALLGRSGSLRSAWQKTRGNYWEFLLLSLLINLSFVAVQQFSQFVKAPMPLMLLICAPLIIYFNIMLAKLYEFFFLDND